MIRWELVAVLIGALMLGFGSGWLLCSRANLRSPNAWVTTLILMAGSVGGPAVTYGLAGATPTSYALAVAVAGFAAGATFWPMGRTQGAREWL